MDVAPAVLSARLGCRPRRLIRFMDGSSRQNLPLHLRLHQPLDVHPAYCNCSATILTTPLKLPNGSMAYPSADIPPMQIYAVHLSHGLKKGPVAALTDNFLKSVTMDPSDYEVDEINAFIVGAGEDRKVALNMTLIRLYQFAAQDIHGLSMLMSDTILANQPLDAADRAIKNLMRSGRKSKSAEADTRLGVDIVNELIKLDYDGGLSYMFVNLVTDESLSPYTSRLHMLKWALSESPLFAWVIGKCAESFHQNKRVLVIAIEATSPYSSLASSSALPLQFESRLNRCGNDNANANANAIDFEGIGNRMPTGWQERLPQRKKNGRDRRRNIRPPRYL